MSGSTIPGTISALTALFTTAAPSPIVVDVGPRRDPPRQFLSVAWDRSDQPGVVASNVRDDAAAARGHESYDVTCLLSLEVGNESLVAVIADAFTAFNALSAALAADRTLGRTVLKTWISEYEMTPIVTDAGDVVDVRFTVQVDAVK